MGKSEVLTGKVCLKLPCRPEFVGVARLVVLGVASRMAFNYDEVEDLRLAVGEAFTNAIERSQQKGVQDAQIQLECVIEPHQLVIRVKDNIPGVEAKGTLPLLENASEEQQINALLMELLTDEIYVASSPETGTTITLVKKVGKDGK